MRFGSAPLLTNGSMSGSLFSHGIDLQQGWIYSIQAFWSGPAVGELYLQISADNPTPPLSGPPSPTDPAAKVVNWTTYSGSASSTSASAGSSSFLWNVLPGHRWVRMAYTALSGSGTINAQYFGRGN